MRSLECATSDRKRASLWRRWRSPASDAPSTASETCVASASSESTCSGRTAVGEPIASTPRVSSRTESGNLRTESPSTKRSWSASTEPARSAGLGPEERTDRGDGRFVHLLAACGGDELGPRLAQRELARDGALLLPD